MMVPVEVKFRKVGKDGKLEVVSERYEDIDPEIMAAHFLVGQTPFEALVNFMFCRERAKAIKEGKYQTIAEAMSEPMTEEEKKIIAEKISEIFNEYYKEEE